MRMICMHRCIVPRQRNKKINYLMRQIVVNPERHYSFKENKMKHLTRCLLSVFIILQVLIFPMIIPA